VLCSPAFAEACGGPALQLHRGAWKSAFGGDGATGLEMPYSERDQTRSYPIQADYRRWYFPMHAPSEGTRHGQVKIELEIGASKATLCVLLQESTLKPVSSTVANKQRWSVVSTAPLESSVAELWRLNFSDGLETKPQHLMLAVGRTA